MKRIGLVLPEAPQYSETFFNYKIKGLQESGFEVIIFSGKKAKQKLYFVNFPDKSAYPVFKNKPVKQIFYLTFVLFLTLIKCPGKALKLFFLEREDGKSILESMKSVYYNAHILPFDLDILHFGFATMTLKRENVSKAMNAKMSVSFRGYDINIYPLKNPGCYNKLWNNADKIHTISNYLREKALSLGLSSDKPFQKITPAIDCTLFKIKEDSGKIKNPLTILTVGRLNWIKDYETAISVMKILKDRGLDFIYNIIGTGSEAERLKFAVYQSGLDDRIFFLGSVGHNEVMEKMRESDIYLQTSFQEGFCVSVLEAQATGLLCVVSDAEGLKENVIDGVTGWIVPRRNPEAFAEKIIELKNLPEENRKEVAKNARRRVEEDFRIEEQKIKFREFFAE